VQDSTLLNQGRKTTVAPHGICKKDSNIYHLSLTLPESDEILGGRKNLPSVLQ
jgi:hypothetical protein